MKIDLRGKHVLVIGGNFGLGAVVPASDVVDCMTATTVFVDSGMTDYPDFMHGG
jgi:hypothetical protein